MIYTPEEVKVYKGFEYIERHGLKFFILEGVSRNRWLKLRALDGALGGSDVGTILGWNYRQSRIELFYQKIGLNFSASEEHTQYTYWGSKNERAIMHAAQYYDFNDPMAYIHNESTGHKLRDITELKFSVRNPDVPYLNANIDGATDFNPVTSMARRIAESKTISDKSAEMWESIPPYHLGQVIMYMHALKPMLLEDYAEIYYLRAGNNFYGWEIPQSKILLEIIHDNCEKFYAKVQKGLEIVANTKSADDRSRYLFDVEPDPDDTKAYEQFMKESHKTKKNLVKVKGAPDMQDVALKYVDLDKKIKALEAEQQKEKNKIWQVLNHNSASVIELDGGGKISFNKRLYVNPSK